MGIKSYVKWPNDILIENKKLCGILTEMNAELTKINYCIVGIGINVNIEKNDFPEEIKDIATSLKICKNYSALIGKEIVILDKTSITPAKAIDIDSEGRLVVKYDSGDYDYLISGEVSIRKKWPQQMLWLLF